MKSWNALAYVQEQADKLIMPVTFSLILWRTSGVYESLSWQASTPTPEVEGDAVAAKRNSRLKKR